MTIEVLLWCIVGILAIVLVAGWIVIYRSCDEITRNLDAMIKKDLQHMTITTIYPPAPGDKGKDGEQS